MGSVGIEREEFEAAFEAVGIEVDAEDPSLIYFYMPDGLALSVRTYSTGDTHLTKRTEPWR